MDRKTIVNVLEEIALLLELKGENTFKIRAYTNAARILGSVDDDPVALIRSGAIADMKGFGKALVEKLTELVETESSSYLVSLRSEFPDTLQEVLRVPGVGPKKVKLFYDALSITSVDALEAACRDGRVAALPGLGGKTADKIVAAIERMRTYQSLYLFSEAEAAAQRVMAELSGAPGLERLEIAGSLRRFTEVTKDIDLLGAAEDTAPVMDRFCSMNGVAEILSRGKTKSTVILDSGIQVDLRLVPVDTFPYALLHFTGSQAHNVAMRRRALERGLKLSEWGLFQTGSEGVDGERIECTDEAALFQQLGLSWIPPELREDMGEIERAEAGPFPELVSEADYRGVLHGHTHASDGTASIEEIVTHAQDRGHSYVGITDHSKSSFQANGLSEERLLRQIDEIEKMRAGLGEDFTLFSAVECDILMDGNLDYDDEMLARLDYVIVSIHSGFTRSRDEMTDRIVRAIEHPLSRILAHPTGRVLLRRDPYQIDLDRVMDAAAANNVAIELNCNPVRLDMSWRWWLKASERGVLCSINPDAHRLADFDYVRAGMGFARKGRLVAEQVINCWDTDRLRAFFGG